MKPNILPNLHDLPVLEQLSGDSKGRLFTLKEDHISIGRNDNNDIVIVGEAVSRYHAAIERSEQGQFVVKDQQSRNGVQVNGATVGEAALRDGDLVQVGSFIFRFRLPAGSQSAGLAMAAPDRSALVEGPNPAGEADGDGGEAFDYEIPGAGGSGKSAGGTNQRRLVIYSVLGVVLLLVYLSSQQEKPGGTGSDGTSPAANGMPPLPEPPPPPSLPSSGNEGAASSKIVGLEDPLLKGDDEAGARRGMDLREAEQYFRKGQREYTNENYHRAVEFFRTALTLNRQHELATYYLGLSYFELEKMANKNFEIGRKYFESMHYSRATYHFQEVIHLLAHRPKDNRIRDAEKFISLAIKKLRDAQQFP